MTLMLEVRNISKHFGGVRALEDVSLDVRAGEVHCLMGENGAGKSTLLRILAGLQPADSGEVLLRGELCRFRSPDDAIRRGVAMIHQELMPFPEMTVAENIFIGREPVQGWQGWIDRKRLHRDARETLQRLGVAIEPGRRMGELSVSETQMVEIAKALARQASLIIMDEPTSSLSLRETRALFRLIGDLKGRGAAIIYVSHKMDEVFEVGDRATVLRDGRAVGTDLLSNLDETILITRMVGRPVGARRRTADAGAGEEVLAVANLSRRGRFSDVSFRVRRGEILGFAGLMGAGVRKAMAADAANLLSGEFEAGAPPFGERALVNRRSRRHVLQGRAGGVEDHDLVVVAAALDCADDDLA
jgi:inositol transport system ATP-binding protein